MITFGKQNGFLIIFETVYHRSFIFHMLISPNMDSTTIDFVFFRSRGNFTRVAFICNEPIDFRLSGSKVKVTMVTFVK